MVAFLISAGFFFFFLLADADFAAVELASTTVSVPGPGTFTAS